jgi:hypothetical protein
MLTFSFFFQKLPLPEPEDNSTVAYSRGEDSTTTGGDESTIDLLPAFCGGREQIMAELREASNLMADSVTPEAAQFWRQHVVALQKRLQGLQTNKPGASSGSSMVGCDERNFADLVQNTCYIPPSADERSQYTTGTGAGTELGQKQRQTATSKQKMNESVTNTLDPELQGLPMIDVIAPANLPEGYTFEAEIEECRFVATVPSGGVRKGEAFSCYMRDMEKVGDSDIPLRKWRDELFDCFKHGPIHPMLVNSFFCPLCKYNTIDVWFFLFYKTNL